MKKSKEWKDENGRFIPLPKNYLASERWEGFEIPEPKVYKKNTILELLEKDEKAS